MIEHSVPRVIETHLWQTGKCNLGMCSQQQLNVQVETESRQTCGKKTTKKSYSLLFKIYIHGY